MNDTQNFVTVEIETKLRARYSFPDVAEEHVREILLHELTEQDDLGDKTIMLVNLSEAVLVLPVRILKSITFRDVMGATSEVWSCGA